MQESDTPGGGSDPLSPSDSSTTETSQSGEPPADPAMVAACRSNYVGLRDELAKIIVGQGDVVEQVMIAMIASGHALLEGVPGLAKTLIVSSLARALHLTFKRIQFTPDLMPSDVTGTDVLQEDPNSGSRSFRFLPGPVFANIVLADEINRTPPKTQAAMLEAMQERQVSAGGTMHTLPAPFFVLATQNPLEQEGTYPLPEAQLDRFLLHVRLDYPSGMEEWEIARRVTAGSAVDVAASWSGEEILQLQSLARQVAVADQVLGYAWTLVRSSRPDSPEAPEFVNRWVRWGAGPRGLLALISAAKARAVLHGRCHASMDDVRLLATPALRHRIAGNYAAQAHQIDSQRLIEMLLEQFPTDREYPKPSSS